MVPPSPVLVAIDVAADCLQAAEQSTPFTQAATETRSRIGLGIVYFIDLGESFRLRVKFRRSP